MMSGLLFLCSYLLLLFSLMMWSMKHPLAIGALVLISYVIGSGAMCVSVSFVVGIFLFLTGVSGMMVAFLYVVALCPNPVFSSDKVELQFLTYLLGWLFVAFMIPMSLMLMMGGWSFGIECLSLSERVQWLREPSMYGGLATIMPLLGFVLFLCMVSVVCLCNEQKQCLGGQSSPNMSSWVKREYM